MLAPLCVNGGMTQFHPLDAGQWAEKYFGGLELGDRRRAKRAVTIAQGIAAHTGKSIPSLFPRTADIKATYTFFQRPEATPNRLQDVHQQQVKAEMIAQGLFCCLETALNSPGVEKPRCLDLGALGTCFTHQEGFYAA